MSTVIYGAHGWTVTLDPGGFVVRDPKGRAMECHNAKHKAWQRLTVLSSGMVKPDRLFEPAPNVIAGQLGIFA